MTDLQMLGNSSCEFFLVSTYQIIKYINENPQNVVIFKIILSIHIVFQYQSKIIRVIELKKNRINFLFIAVIYFPLSI